MRIPSGVTDQYIYFAAVDATDFTTRESHVSGFTVARSRNNSAATLMTTPTLASMGGDMPGVHSLLLDEDMAISAGNYSEEMVFHISSTDGHIAPVTRTIELYDDRMNTATGQGAAIIATQATHTNRLSTATTGINDVQNKAATATTGINAVQATQTAHSASLSTATTGVNDLQNKAITATTGINALETSVAALETSMSFATGSIDQLLLDVADVDAGVSVATDALSALSTGGGHTADLIETVDTVVDGLRVSMDYATDTLSYLSTGGGPFPGGGSAPTATEVANAVLSQTSADHTADGTFGGDVLGSLQSATDQISALAVAVQTVDDEVAAIEASVTFATKGIDQALIGIGTATDAISALATGGGAAAAPTVADILTTQMTESYAADGTAPTLAQALFLIQQELGDFAISGTTLTVRQLDGSTTAATFTLDDASAPTSKTRSG